MDYIPWLQNMCQDTCPFGVWTAITTTAIASNQSTSVGKTCEQGHGMRSSVLQTCLCCSHLVTSWEYQKWRSVDVRQSSGWWPRCICSQCPQQPWSNGPLSRRHYMRTSYSGSNVGTLYQTAGCCAAASTPLCSSALLRAHSESQTRTQTPAASIFAS
jgi:hypothetical protein